MKNRKLVGFVVKHRKFFGVIAFLIALTLWFLAINTWGSDGALAGASAGTLVATAVLAWFTLRLVDVTKAMTPEPAIVLALSYFGTNVFLELHNAGSGAAVDINVKIEWTASNNELVESYSFEWRAAILPAGAHVRFTPRKEKDIHLQADLLKCFDRIIASGTMTNSRGVSLNICGKVENPGELFELEVISRRQLRSGDGPEYVLASSVKRISDILDQRLKKG